MGASVGGGKSHGTVIDKSRGRSINKNSYAYFSKRWRQNWTKNYIDPLDWPTVTTCSDHYFTHVVCTSVCTSIHFKMSQNKTNSSGYNDRYWRIVGLAERIIDDTCIVVIIFFACTIQFWIISFQLVKVVW